MKRFLPVVVILLSLIFSASSVHAVGMGFYGSAGSGSSDWDAPGTTFSAYDSFNTDNTHKAFGLALDTRLAGDKLFNYHLNLGYDTFKVKDFLLIPNITSTLPVMQSDLTMKGMVWSHSFGFGGELIPGTRLWLGPELRFQWAKGKPTPTVDVEMFGVGFGPAIGFNMNVGHRFTVVIKGGYSLIRYDADINGSLSPGNSVSRNLDVEEKLTYINLEFFVRSLSDR